MYIGLSVDYRWESSEDEGGAEIKSYIVEYFRDTWNVWLKAKTLKSASATQTTIDDLIPGSRYKFRIKADNDYGISEPSDESDPFDVGPNASLQRYIFAPLQKYLHSCIKISALNSSIDQER